jgi:hypothetical protein
MDEEQEDDRMLVEALERYENDQALRAFVRQHDREADSDSDEEVQDGGGQAALYRVVRTTESRNSKFDVVDRTIRLVWDSMATSFQHANEQVDALFQPIYDDHIRELSNNTKIRIIVQHDMLDSPVSTHLVDKDQFTPDLISSIFFNTLQSRKCALSEAMRPQYNMKINLAICTVVKGGHRGQSGSVAANRERIEDIIDLDTFCRNSKFITVLKKSNYCLVQAIVIAKALHDGEHDACKLKHSPKSLVARVLKIVHDLRLPNEHMGVQHIQRIEEYLKEYSIVCYQGGDR